MKRTYRVDPNKHRQFALRKTLKRTLLFILIAALFSLILIVINGESTDHPFFQSWWALLIFPLFVFYTYWQQARLAKVLKFELDDNKLVRVIQSDNKTSLVTRILFKDIKNLVITKNTLKVKAKQYNMLTRKGLISLPKELENYEEIVDFFRKFRGIAG